MKKILALAALSMLALVGCGGSSDEDALQSGAYTLSNVNLTSALDECDIGPGLRASDYALQLTSAGKDVTFFSDSGTKPVATVDDNNAFTGTAETTQTDTGCTFKVTKTITGNVTSTTAFTASYTFKMEVVSGGAACTQDVLGFSGTACTSTYSFNAATTAATQQ